MPAAHPLRRIRTLADEALAALSPRLEQLSSPTGRPSIAPERLLRALLLQAFSTGRSERLLREQRDDNLLFRWFAGLSVDEPVWDATTFTKNRDRLLAGEVAQEFFRQLVRRARAAGLTSAEHGTVDGTLVEAWAGHQSLARQDSPVPSDDDRGNPTVNFRQEKRTNATHQSTSDPEARLDKKSPGAEAKLASLGHVVTENRHGLVVNARLTLATGTAERAAALAIARERPGGTRRLTLGADKGYDAAGFIQSLRELT